MPPQDRSRKRKRTVPTESYDELQFRDGDSDEEEEEEEQEDPERFKRSRPTDPKDREIAWLRVELAAMTERVSKLERSARDGKENTTAPG